MGVPVKSTIGLLLSKPSQSLLTLPTSSYINGIERKDSIVVSIKNHVKIGLKLLNIVKHKLGYGAKFLPLGREEKIFSKFFGTSDCDKLVHASRCCIYTTAGTISGTLFVSNERVAFCSDRSLKTYSATGEVSIPLGKIKGIGESVNMKRPSKKYPEFVTVDGFNFWFLSFTNENLHVEFLENKGIEQGAGLNWLFGIDSLTKSMNYVPVDAGINSTNLSGTKDAANQEVKKDESSLRYIVLPNRGHDALLESTSSKPYEESSTQVPEDSGNPNPTASSSNPPADQMETLTVESPIPTVSSPVPTACLNDSPKPSSEA
nr:hypothetical protein [Tanacetum cinerariifolium]